MYSKSLINSGADVNVVIFTISKQHCKYLNEKLKHAVKFGYIGCVHDLLLKAGADVNEAISTISQQDCVELNKKLRYAVRCGYVGCVDLLLKAGADVNTKDEQDRSMLFCALVTEATYLGKRPSPLMDSQLISIELLSNIICCPNSPGHVCGKKKIKYRLKQIGPDFPYPLPPSDCEKLACTKLLLKAGAHVNTTQFQIGRDIFSASGTFRVETTTCSTLETYMVESSPHYDFFNVNLAMLLYAAGEIVHGTIIRKLDHHKNFRNKLFPVLQAEDNLKHMCRSAIRKHLLRVNSSINLFVRIPQLGFPSLLKDYLLYNMSLEIGCEKV